MRDMTFLELSLVVGDVDINTAVRNQPSLIERIFTWMAHRYEFVVPLKLRKLEGRNPAQQVQSEFVRVREALGHRGQFRTARHSMEPAGLDIDGVNLAPPEQ